MLFQKFGAERSVQVGLSCDRGSQDNPIAECTFRRLIALCWARDDRTLGHGEDVAESGGLYLSLVGGSIVLLGLMTSLGALIRATHNPRLPLYVSLLSNALNILFSSLAIFVLDMGIAGVAWGLSCLA